MTLSETAPTETPPRGRRGVKVSAFVERYGLLLVWLLVFLFFSFLPQTGEVFATTDNLATIFGSQAVIVVLTLALLVPLTAGDYDLSVAFTLTLSAMTIAVLNVNEGWPVGLAIVAALILCACVGVVNGALAIYFGIDSLIVTLGTGTFIGGLVLWMSDSNTISGVSNALVEPVIVYRLLGVPLVFYYGLLIAAVMWYVFEFTPLGRRLLVVGRGRNVARLSGVNVGRIRLGALVASALISGLAGVFYAGTSGAADPTSGPQLLLPAFAAAFLGATTIMPGRFNPWGAVIAVYFLVTGITGLQLLGVRGFVQQLFYGGALVLAVVLSQIARRREALDTS